MMGSGKSTVGNMLADQLAFSFIDTDVFIVQNEGQSIRTLFETEGETYFRLLEQKVIESLPKDNMVVACGGGLPCFNGLMSELKERGTVIYLEAPIGILLQRLENHQDRPLYLDKDQFKQLFNQRESIYKQAHHTLDGQLAPVILAGKIVELLTNQGLV